MSRGITNAARIACATVLSSGVFVTAASGATLQAAPIIAAVNAERTANGIPAGLTENSTYTADCGAHDAYGVANGGFDSGTPLGAHGETKANATLAGQQGGTHSVLFSGDTWTSGSDPFESAPFHLLQILDPRLQFTGADERDGSGGPYSCLWTSTFNGDNTVNSPRPAPAAQTLYGWPGPSRADAPWFEFAEESPYVPGDVLGLTHGAATGPEIQVYNQGPATFTRLCAGSVTPSGGAAVNVKLLGAGAGSNPPTDPLVGDSSGFVIPAAVLDPSKSYAVSATFGNAACDAAPQLRFTSGYSFTTEAQKTPAQLVHIGDSSPSGGDLAVPYAVDEPLAHATGTVTVTFDSGAPFQVASGKLGSGGTVTFTNPSPGHSVTVAVNNDTLPLGSVTYPATSVTRTFSTPGAAAGGTSTPAPVTATTTTKPTVTTTTTAIKSTTKKKLPLCTKKLLKKHKKCRKPKKKKKKKRKH